MLKRKGRLRMQFWGRQMNGEKAEAKGGDPKGGAGRGRRTGMDDG